MRLQRTHRQFHHSIMRYPFRQLLAFKVLHLCMFNLTNLLRSELCAYYFPFQIFLNVGHDDGGMLGQFPKTARDTLSENGRFRPDRLCIHISPRIFLSSCTLMTAGILRVSAQRTTLLLWFTF